MADDHRTELKPGHKPYPKPATTLSRTGRSTPIENLLRTAIKKQQASDATDALRRKVGKTFANMTGANQGTSGTLSKGKGPARSESPEETTFQPRITDKPATASSSSNWRRTDAPPHISDANVTMQLLAKLKAQRDADQICHDREDARLQQSVMSCGGLELETLHMDPLDPQETPWLSFIVGSLGFTPDRCKRPLGNRSLALERPPDPQIQLGTALRPSFDELHPPRPLDPDGSSETVWSGPQILGFSSGTALRPSD
ncbi:hypothetical protein PGT21_010555 [Puccinia graminis f. sp. tritici]|uniref:Uncharacterized protein n=1 Tax=Puccinia graminis f. sp. tritici TaxID=56615 RepID=A0A5B0MEP9_PUCGR|nr:hypothetical protein PGT21_010555 [Puccinia graminis f. sp. tritici]